VRSVVRPWDKDRYMSPDIESVTNLLKEEKIWNAAKGHMEHYHSAQVKMFSNINQNQDIF